MAAISENRPDAVLLDLSLGNESGLDLLVKIKSLARHIPVIMITGYATLDASFQAIKLGAIDFL